MAKEEKDGQKGADYEFIPPDFDEDAFIHREVTGFRATAILVCWGIIAAVASFGAFVLMGGGDRAWAVGLGMCAAFGVSLKWLLPALKADIGHYKRKEWLGTGFLFFFTWLSILILMLNPPVSDFSEPRLAGYAQPALQEAGGPVELHVFAADNTRVSSFAFTLRQGQNVVATQDDAARDGDRWTYTVPAGSPGGTYEWTATATDPKGHTTSASGSFRITRGAVDLTAPAVLDAASRVVVRISAGEDQAAPPACTASLIRKGTACIRTVVLEHTSGDLDPVVLEYEEGKDRWSADSEHKGWRDGPNEVRVTAATADIFDGSDRVEGGVITSGPYNITVPGGGGSYVPKVLADPAQPSHNVPGAGLAAVLAVLAMAALVARRRA